MKILAAGDIHGDSSLAIRLAQKAKQYNVDLVILTGDLTFNNMPFTNIIKPFIELNKRVLVVPGNHDTIATINILAEIYGIKNIHGYSVVYDNVGIFGCSGVNIGNDALTEKEIYYTLKRGFEKIKDLEKKIMVTHVPPKGALSEALSFVVSGSEGVKKALEKFKPNILLCSHIHEAEGIEQKLGDTLIINVGRQGKILEL